MAERALEAGEVRSLAARLVSDELIVYPVRHHSPACSLQLQRLLAKVRPCAVLVEGPSAFDALIDDLTHPEARAPLAIYTYAVHGAETYEGLERRSAAYYPFCDYSPELVALRDARRRGLPAQFIDLDFAEQEHAQSSLETDEAQTLLDERYFRRSHYLRLLAEQQGCRDSEELWEHLFEVRASSTSFEAHVAQVTAYCELARRDTSAESLAAEGTLQREAEMAWHIQRALAQRRSGDGPVLAVMGGFHAVVMPILLEREVERPRRTPSSVRDQGAALIRYGFERLDRLHGYGAGMTSPAWHQRVWEASLKGADNVALERRLREQTVLGVLFDVAEELRRRFGIQLPVPASSAAFEQALRLATLRGRPAPVRDDVMDAVVSCFIQGDADTEGALVRRTAQSVLCGKAFGKVPAGTPVPPLVRDFELRARRQRLKLDDSDRRRLALDLYRRPEHRVTSRLLHGLALLEVPFAVRTAGPDFVRGTGLERLIEHWDYSYSPLTEGALVEASVLGATVPLAVAQRFIARLEALESEGKGRDARSAAETLVHGCVLGLHDHLPRAMDALRAAIGEDMSFDGLTSAVTCLALLWESREPLEARELPQLPEMIRTAYERALYVGGDVPGNSERALSIATALVQIRELLRSAAGRDLNAELYWHLLERLRADHASALVRGACVGLLQGPSRLTSEALGSALRGHLSGLSEPREAVAFLRGLLHTAHELGWQEPAVLETLNDLFASWDQDQFLAVLPELRLAFSVMTPSETDRIAGAVGELHGRQGLGPLVRHDLSEVELERNLRTSSAVRRILEADGLEDWGAEA